MKLYCQPGHYSTQKVLVAAKLCEVPLTILPAEDAPSATVPLLVTEEGSLPQSNAILRFLANSHADRHLYGLTPFEAGTVDMWLDWCLHELEVPAAVLTYPKLGLLDREAVRPAATKSARAELLKALGALDSWLATRTFLGSRRLSVADVAVACVLYPVFSQGVVGPNERQGLPEVCRWFLTCCSQPVFVEVLGEAPFAAGGATTGKRAPAAAATAAAASSAAAPRAAAASAAAGGAADAAAAGASELPAASPLGVETPYPVKFTQSWQRRRVRVRDLIMSADGGRYAVGQELTVCGWIKTTRAQGAFGFVELSDGSTMAGLQVLVYKDRTEGFDAVMSCGGVGASVQAKGVIVESPAKGQAVEMQATEVKVLGGVSAAHYPLAKKRHSLEFLRSVAHLRARTNTIGAVARVRHACAYATHRFFRDRGFLYVHTPIITTADCEGAGEMFAVSTLLPSDPKAEMPRRDGAIDYSRDFFGQPAFLTVSGQLNVETFCSGLSDVYTFGPTFRAENSHTSRHLAEFWMIEPEIAFADINDDMALAEDYLKFCVQYVLENCADDIAFFDERVEKGLHERLLNVYREPFKRITYTEAVELLNHPDHRGNLSAPPKWGDDLASEHERYMTDKVYKKPVIVINYPKDIKAFYMKLNPDGRTVAAMDILVPKIGEIIGGSQREEDLDTLTARMAEMGLKPEAMPWYMDLRRFGTMPHAGFGLGFERLVMFVTGMENIRDVIPFPRFPNSAVC